MLLVNTLWSFVLWTYYWEFDDFFDKEVFTMFWLISQGYFLLVTIIWLIKYVILKKKWPSQKASSSAEDSKMLSYLVLFLLLLVVVCDVIFGKYLYSQIPETDISNFIRTNHIKRLSKSQDWVVILKSKEKKNEVNNIWNVLDRAYSNRFSAYAMRNTESHLSWKEHSDECIKVYSWGQAYCWTWALSESTLRRLFRNQLSEEYIKSDESLSGKVISLYTYLEERESEIRKEVLEMNRLLSLDYYAENWLKNDLMPQNFQSYTRWSIVLIGYYSLKKDWDMVLKLVENDFKMADITNNFWWLIWVLISNVIVENTYSNLNNLLQIFPEDIRIKLSKIIEDKSTDYDDVIKHIMQWEVENWKEFIDAISEGYKYDGSLNQIMYHYPFYSESDSKRLLNHFYNTFNNLLNEKEVAESQEFYQKIFDGESDFRWSIYNIEGMRMLMALAPRLQWATTWVKRINVHKESLLKNLDSWNYEAWYAEPEWEIDNGYYRDNIIE